MIVLTPAGVTKTDETELCERLTWPYLTPLMVVVGIAHDFSWPDLPSSRAIAASFLLAALQAFAGLTFANARIFKIAAVSQLILFGQA